MSSEDSNNIAVSRYKTSYGKLINYVLIPHTRPLHQDYITFFLEISHHLKLHITKLIKSRLVHSTSVTSVEINPPTKHDWSTNNYTIIDLSNIIMYVNYDTSEDTNRSTIPDYTESKTTYTCNKTTYPKEILGDVKHPQISRLSSTYINSDIQLQFLTLELAHVRQQLHYKTLEVNEQALVIQRQSVEIGILKNKQIEQQTAINNITSVYLSAREEKVEVERKLHDIIYSRRDSPITSVIDASTIGDLSPPDSIDNSISSSRSPSLSHKSSSSEGSDSSIKKDRKTSPQVATVIINNNVLVPTNNNNTTLPIYPNPYTTTVNNNIPTSVNNNNNNNTIMHYTYSGNIGNINTFTNTNTSNITSGTGSTTFPFPGSLSPVPPSMAVPLTVPALSGTMFTVPASAMAPAPLTSTPLSSGISSDVNN